MLAPTAEGLPALQISVQGPPQRSPRVSESWHAPPRESFRISVDSIGFPWISCDFPYDSTGILLGLYLDFDFDFGWI